MGRCLRVRAIDQRGWGGDAPGEVCALSDLRGPEQA